MPAAAAPNRTPASGGRSGNGTASGETGEAMSVSLDGTGLLLAWRGRRHGGVAGAHLRPVEVEFLNRRRGPRLRHGLLHTFLNHLLPQFVVRLIEAGRFGATALHQQDD